MCDKKDNINELQSQLEPKYKNAQCGNIKSGTSTIYETFNLPHRFECPHLFRGYGIQKCNQNTFYKTVNSEYGRLPPSPHTVPHRFFPRTQHFSTALAKSGMYRNYSLNTAMDKGIY